MFYNSIIYLLIVILLFSVSSAPDVPQLSSGYALIIFGAKLFLYQQLARTLFSRRRVTKAPHYFHAEQRGSIVAVIFLALDVYLLDCQYYFAKLPLAGAVPTVGSLAGLVLFFSYLAVLWSQAATAYQRVFGRRYQRADFLLHNLKNNLPVVLPWLILSLFGDLLGLLPIPGLRRFMASAWGESAVFFSFFLVLAMFFPVILTRLWNCSPLPDGAARRHIEAFCRRQRLPYANILHWPLFEGQVLTAAVVGLVRRFRYLLVTPALMDAMTPDEVEAVMAHEIGHVKRYHMQLYLVLFIGFGVLAQLSSYPVLYLVLQSDLFYRLVDLTNREPGAALSFVSTLPMLFFLIIYFRFIFGFFMRNFERQADLYAFAAMGTGRPLARVLEKIAVLSGNIRDLPSWHHFGIGQRVDFLEKCEREPGAIRRHHRKVATALGLYLLTVLAAGLALWKMPSDLLDGAPREKFAVAVLQQKIEEEPDNYVWFLVLGDLQQSRRRYHQAAEAYEQALARAPENPDVLNNLAWLRLTAAEPSVRDRDQALVLARDAARRKPAAYILDTLAEAYSQNGFAQLALEAEKTALARAGRNEKYYAERLARFQALADQ